MKRKVNHMFLLLLISVGIAALLVGYYAVVSRQSKFLKNLADCQAGDVIDDSQINMRRLKQYFTIEDIDEALANEMMGKSYQSNDHIHLEDLRYVKVLHYNYQHEIQVGELVVNQSIAKDCQDIFLELFKEEYEIHSMYLVDRYYNEAIAGELAGEASDFASVSDNNSSGFNYRNVKGYDVLSAHGMGLAIDINPVENPCVQCMADGSIKNDYPFSEEYVDRTIGKKHMISSQDVCYQLFAAHGFSWGGDWENTLDYQHFEKVD